MHSSRVFCMILQSMVTDYTSKRQRKGKVFSTYVQNNIQLYFEEGVAAKVAYHMKNSNITPHIKKEKVSF